MVIKISLRKGKERHPSFPEAPEGSRHLCSDPVRTVIVTEHQFIPLTQRDKGCVPEELWIERTEEQGLEMLGRCLPHKQGSCVPTSLKT